MRLVKVLGLTKEGQDYYPIPPSTLTWVMKWLPQSRGGLVLRRRGCGLHFDAVLDCEQCDEPVMRDDAHVEQSPTAQ